MNTLIFIFKIEIIVYAMVIFAVAGEYLIWRILFHRKEILSRIKERRERIGLANLGSSISKAIGRSIRGE